MRAALYARVSTHDKGQTNENQLRRLRDAATARGWEVAGEYADHRSGADQSRPELDRMVRDARAGKVDVIMIVRLDRIARSLSNLTALLENLDAINVRVSCLDQPIDTSTATGRFTTQVLGAAAEFEKELIRDRVRDGLNRAKAEGKTLGRPSRKLSDHHLAKARRILEESPGISHLQLSQHFEGVSRNTLIRHLRREGIL